MERSTSLNRNLKKAAGTPCGRRSAGTGPRRTIFSALLILSLAGCGTVSATRVPWEAERPDGCRTLFERLDAVVLERGVRDAADATVPGFPYLRANRFVASLAGGSFRACRENGLGRNGCGSSTWPHGKKRSQTCPTIP